MASWPPLSHKNLYTVFWYCKLTTPVWVDAVDKRYFRYTAQPFVHLSYLQNISCNNRSTHTPGYNKFYGYLLNPLLSVDSNITYVYVKYVLFSSAKQKISELEAAKAAMKVWSITICQDYYCNCHCRKVCGLKIVRLLLVKIVKLNSQLLNVELVTTV